MWNSRLTIVTGILLLGALGAYAQQPDEVKRQQQMAKEMQLAQPGPEHKILADMSGKWDLEIKMWPAPGQQPMTVAATAENELVLGGRFLKINSKGQMMGMPIESIIMMGFDRRKEEYTWVGFDSYGTYYVTAAGKYDEASKTIVMSGEDFDPIMGGKQIYDVIVNFVDADTHVIKICFKNKEFTQGKGDFCAVEITSKRQK